MKIGILGAGIIGVNTALQIRSEFPTAKITVLADSFTEDTLSNGAAGIFRPGTNLSFGHEELTEKIIVDSYNFYNGILHSEDAFRAGVMQVSGYIFSSTSASITKNQFLERLLPIYRAAREDELRICPWPDKGTGREQWKYGAFFQTMVVESGLFLPWAMEMLKVRGVEVKERRIEVFTDLIGDSYDYVINCSGFGSKWLCGDRKLVPIRGQVYKVKAPWVKMFYYGDYDTYIIPGSTTVTLGGTRQFDSYNKEVDPYDSAAIWDRCTSLLPSLRKVEIVKEWVGLRPYRDPVRCGDAEIVSEGQKKVKVIHQYGHGGYGVTSAPGSAIHCTKVLKEAVRSGKLPRGSGGNNKIKAKL